MTDDRSEHPDILAAIAELRVDATKPFCADYRKPIIPIRHGLCAALVRLAIERAGMTLRGLGRKWLSSGWGVRPG